ncbi:MAG: sigma-70 family RNA polymerase sigma factor [Candidatus Aminicenantes bacterium]|nr:sigma-70 family RNA polymerase sigma factor [Candidatus Aminicenantes bacterium]
MKVSIGQIWSDYHVFIRKAIHYWMWSYGDIEKDEVFDIIMSELGKVKEIRGEYGEGSLKAFIWRVVTWRCVDYYRKVRSRRRKEERLNLRKTPSNIGITDPQGILEKYGIEDIRHIELLEAQSEGMKRKEIAKEFNLSEMQVKGRLEYAKGKLKREVKRILARTNLKKLSRGE